MEPAGRFITFEGIDGAGKSTHLQTLARHWQQTGLEVVCTREPGGTPVAESLRNLFLTQAMDVVSEVLLVFAARREHLLQVIEPALARGAVVLCDRFTDATFAYQGAGRGVPTGPLTALEQWVQQGRQPDLTLWFDVPPAVAAQRRAAARAPDRMEREDLAFFQRVAGGYARRCAEAPGRFVRIDAAGDPAAVARQVLDAVRSRPW